MSDGPDIQCRAGIGRTLPDVPVQEGWSLSTPRPTWQYMPKGHAMQCAYSCRHNLATPIAFFCELVSCNSLS